MIPAWLLWAGGGLLIASAVALPLRLENRRAHWQEAHHEEQKARKLWQGAFKDQKARYINAQAAAKAKAEAEKLKDIATYRTLAERADHADQEIARYRALADRYARARSVRNQGSGTARRDASGPDRAGEGSPAGSDHRSGDPTDVVISRTDFDTLVDLSVRAKKAHDWGNDLLAKGLAVRKGEEQ